MRLPGVILPEDLETLSTVLNAHCARKLIDPGTADYENTAALLVMLFQAGRESVESLTAALEHVDQSDKRQAA